MNNHINGELWTRFFHWHGCSQVITKLRSPLVSPSDPTQVWDYLKQGLVFTVYSSLYLLHFCTRLLKYSKFQKMLKRKLSFSFFLFHFTVRVQREWFQFIAIYLFFYGFFLAGWEGLLTKWRLLSTKTVVGSVANLNRLADSESSARLNTVSSQTGLYTRLAPLPMSIGAIGRPAFRYTSILTLSWPDFSFYGRSEKWVYIDTVLGCWLWPPIILAWS